ncbi:MAG: two-component system sensor histidine kinase NtrB [Desulfobacterales bacterium]
MRFLHLKKLYIPALSIVAIVFILLVLISISTYRNLDREKTRALHFLHSQGVTLLRSVEASARTGMTSLMWQEVSLGRLLQEITRDEEISYIYLIDGHGFIAHHSDPSKKGQRATWGPDLASNDQVITRIRELPDGVRIYELAKYFAPMYETSIFHSKDKIENQGQTVARHSHRGDIIVLGMKMTAFEDARHADIQHALIMAGVILVLGSGALFFIFVIQNYYLVNKTLKQTQDYTRQVVASMANGLLSINIEGKITSYNPLALQLLGLKETEIQGMDFKKIIDFKAAGIIQTLDRCITVLDREIIYRRPSGESVPLALSITPILGESNICQGAVIILRDLSEIKQLEEKVRRSEKLAAIGKLAAGVAHEIRNPLSSIRGFAQYLQRSLKNNPQKREYAETMVAEVDRINTVVTDLLTIARPMQTELSPTDVTELIEHAIRLVQADARSRDVNVELNISDFSKIPLDSNQMAQAILNLLLNALQAVNPGGRIEVGAELDPAVSRLKIWVEDNGAGISASQREKIFDPFFTTRKNGTGLGLAIVHKIVENHSGEINLQSPPAGKDRGCRFTIDVPIKSRESSN